MVKLNYKVLDQRLGKSIPLPQYATNGSAAMDLRAVIDEEEKIIKAGESLLVGTGLAFHIADPNYCALVLPRSGLGFKNGIVLGNLVGLIDSDYQGELKVPLWNRSKEDFRLKLGERVAQMLIVPVMQVELNQVQEFSQESQRGECGFGHTGIY